MFMCLFWHRCLGALSYSTDVDAADKLMIFRPVGAHQELKSSSLSLINNFNERTSKSARTEGQTKKVMWIF
jgi:hypothetical protein